MQEEIKQYGVTLIVARVTDLPAAPAGGLLHVSPAFWAWMIVCGAWLVLIWVWHAFYLAMTVDDTFYYLKTATNVAAGRGSTFDGINPTDGYHPLWLAVLAMMAAVLPDDMTLFARVVLTLQVLMLWCSGLFLSRLRHTGGSDILWPLALGVANPFVAKIVLCGQETALELLLSCMALTLWWTTREAPNSRQFQSAVGLGLVCTLAALARLDNVFFCLALLTMPLMLPGQKESAAGLPQRLATTSWGLLVFACGMLPYLAYHWTAYHHLAPVSGAIKLHLSADEVGSPAARLAAVGVACAMGLGFLISARRTRSPRLAVLVPATVGALVIAIYNFGVRGELSPKLVRIWYLEPYFLLLALISGMLLARWKHSRPIRVALGAAAALWLISAGFVWMYRLDARSYNIYQAAQRCSRWVEEHIDSGAVGGAWDAGFAGAFTHKPVMNLDGLINSWEYKEKYLDTGAVDEFILSRHPVDFVVQYMWPTTLRAVASRFEHASLPTAPHHRTTVTGSQDPENLSERWGVDLAPFYVAHAECVMASVAYDPSVTVGPVFYFVLTRAPSAAGRMSLAQFALATRNATSCPRH